MLVITQHYQGSLVLVNQLHYQASLVLVNQLHYQASFSVGNHVTLSAKLSVGKKVTLSNELSVGNHVTLSSNLTVMGTTTATVSKSNKSNITHKSDAINYNITFVDSSTDDYKNMHISNTNTNPFQYNPSTGLLSVKNISLSGDLTVNGDTTTISTQNLLVKDSLIGLSNGLTGSSTTDAGFIIERGSDNNVGIIWDHDQSEFAVVGSTVSTVNNNTINIEKYADFHTKNITGDSITLASTLNVEKAVNFKDTLNVTKAVTLASTLNVGSELNVTKAVTLASTSNIRK